MNLKKILTALTGAKPAGETAADAILRLTAVQADMKREFEDSKAELRAIADRREELLISDNDDALDNDDRRAAILHRNLERAEFALQKIDAELLQAKKDHRAARVAAFRAERDAIARRLLDAMDAATAVNREAMAWHDRVCAELGQHAINAEFSGAIAFPFLAADFISPFKANLAQMAGAPAAAPRAVAPKAVKPKRSTVAQPAPEPRRQRPERPALPSSPPSGHLRVTVLRNGYPDADGVQLSTGDMIDLPNDIAQAAAENGAVEFAGVAA